MKRTITYSMIGLLLLFNIFLLISNREQQKRIKNLSSEINSFKNIPITSDQSQYSLFPNFSVVPPAVNFSESAFTLAVFFTTKGCRSCMINEINNLNSIYNSYKNYIQVFLLSYKQSYLKRIFEAAFPYHTISPEKELFGNRISFTNPVALLIDKNGTIQFVHIAKKGNPGKTDRFYHRMSSLFESLN